jgi:serine/threonine-protein kinase
VLRGRYRVLEKLGAGAMGTVFAVEDTLADGARLALKALWPSGGTGELELSSLRAEFRVLATLRHPSLCRVYDFGRLPAGSSLDANRGAGFFYTRDLVDGVDLAVAAARARADLGIVCRLFADAARALDIGTRSFATTARFA